MTLYVQLRQRFPAAVTFLRNKQIRILIVAIWILIASVSLPQVVTQEIPHSLSH